MMEVDNSQLIEFLENVFFDMGIRNLSNPNRRHAQFKRQLNVMHKALDPMHRGGFETLFAFLPLNHGNAFSLMSAHCSAIWEDCNDDISIFLHFMYTCSFTFSLLTFCESNGYIGISYLYSKWIANRYPDLIEPKFTAANSFEGLNTFCSTLNLHFILDFINLCYNKQGKLFTYLTLGNSYYFYGLHHDDTLNSLKTNIEELKKLVFADFKDDLDGSLIYRTGVILAFVKIQLAFDYTANVFNPPSPTRRLLYPTPIFFRCYLWETIRHKIPTSVRKILIKEKRAEQKQNRLQQLRNRARQKQIPASLPQITSDIISTALDITSTTEQALESLEKLHAILQQSIDIIRPAIEKHVCKQFLGLKAQAPAVVEQASYNEERSSYIDKRATYNLSKAAQSPYITEQIPYFAEQTPYAIEPASYIVEQVPYVVEQASCGEEQVPYVAEQVPYVAEQVPYVAEQVPDVAEQVSYVKEQVHYIKEQVHYIKEQLPYVKEQVPYVKEQVPYVKEQVPYVKEQVPYEQEQIPYEQVPYIDEQALMIGQPPNINGHTSDIIEHGVNTIRRMIHNAEQALAAMNLFPANENSSFSTEPVSGIVQQAHSTIMPNTASEEYFSSTIKQASTIAEQAHTEMNSYLPSSTTESVQQFHASIKSDADDNVAASDNRIRRRPLFRVILVKKPPDEVENKPSEQCTCCYLCKAKS